MKVGRILMGSALAVASIRSRYTSDPRSPMAFLTGHRVTDSIPPQNLLADNHEEVGHE